MVVSILIIVALILCGCGKTITGEDGKDHYLLGRFIEINMLKYDDMDGNKHTQCLAYDKDTKVMYILEYGLYSSAISPYYIFRNGHVENAIYGENYK